VEIRDLSHDERIALVALVELLASSDAGASEDEIDRIGEIGDALGGAEQYRQLAEEVDRRFADEEELKDFLATIDRQEAREVVFETALEVAMPDGIQSREAEFLEWLEDEWGLSVLFFDESEKPPEE